MRQSWEDLLFLHWPVHAEQLRPFVPRQLVIDEFDGFAWLTIVAFRLTVRMRFVPLPLAWLRFPELNVRTYVRRAEQEGIYFLSLDAPKLVPIHLARFWYRLPYRRATMEMYPSGGGFRFSSRRAGRPGVEFRARYRPTGPPCRSMPQLLEHWLTDRYCLFTLDGRGRVFRTQVAHEPWPLQPAEVHIGADSMPGLDLVSDPCRGELSHFSKRIDALVWAPERLQAP